MKIIVIKCNNKYVSAIFLVHEPFFRRFFDAIYFISEIGFHKAAIYILGVEKKSHGTEFDEYAGCATELFVLWVQIHKLLVNFA